MSDRPGTIGRASVLLGIGAFGLRGNGDWLSFEVAEKKRER